MTKDILLGPVSVESKIQECRFEAVHPEGNELLAHLAVAFVYGRCCSRSARHVNNFVLEATVGKFMPQMPQSLCCHGPLCTYECKVPLADFVFCTRA